MLDEATFHSYCFVACMQLTNAPKLWRAETRDWDITWTYFQSLFGAGVTQAEVDLR